MPAADSDRPALLGGSPIAEASLFERTFSPAVAEVFEEASRSTAWSQYRGPALAELRQLLIDAHGVLDVLLCCSGTAAGELALRGLGVGPGDEVVLAAYDFEANFKNVLTVGATPVLIDVLPGGWQFDVAQLESALSPATKAVIVSHLHGQLVPLAPIRELLQARGIALIEDACQVPGARIGGQLAGSFGDVSLHSFGGSKLLTAGRGGTVLTRDPRVMPRLRLHTRRGNEAYPLSELQAMLLVPQWRELAAANERRGRAVTTFLEQERVRAAVGMPPTPVPLASSAFYKLGALYRSEANGLTRAQWVTALRSEAVPLGEGFQSLHRYHSRRRFRTVGALSTADLAHERIVLFHHTVFQSEAATTAAVRAIGKIARHAEALRAYFLDHPQTICSPVSM